MPKLGSEQLALILVIIVGAATAVVTRLGWAGLAAAAPVAVALAAIWALASVAIARLSGRTSLMSIPALAAFVLSIAALVVIQIHHQRFLPFALANAALSAVLVRVAIQFDRRPRG